ncbi:galactokinase [Actinomortierella ambigua]|nr:galactokinase [Actinomortierella ambigua]
MTSSRHITRITDSSILYSAPKQASATARWTEVSVAFEKLYGREPDFIARAPGRVNLIGEHIDYAGFGVLPMAIEDDCLIAVAVQDSDSTVKLANLDAGRYSPLEFVPKSASEGVVEINTEYHVWSNYFKAGYRGFLEEYPLEQPKGMLCLMSGTVPPGAGLSSSSAFVCCAAIATAHAQSTLVPEEKQPTAQELAILAIRSERYVGTMGGGMDQACSILSKPKAALFIEFHPVLKTTPVFFPVTTPPIAFVIANTLVTSDKAVTAPVRYNLRVVETRGAARILARHLGLTVPESGKFHLKQVLDAHFEKIGYDGTGKSEAECQIEQLTAMGKIVEQVFGTEEIRHGVSYAEMCELAGLDEEEFRRLYIHQPIRAKVFHLYRRAKHVYNEEKLVVEFRDVCEKSLNDSSLQAESLFKKLGALMDASQDSCHNLFDCSCNQLEELTQLARRSGAYGSRLTGAGWGGATVSLVAEDHVPEFIRTIKEQFYAKHYPHLSDEELNNAIFASAPSSGAALFVGKF